MLQLAYMLCTCTYSSGCVYSPHLYWYNLVLPNRHKTAEYIHDRQYIQLIVFLLHFGPSWRKGMGNWQGIYIVEYIYYCTTCSYLLVHTCKNVDIYCVVGIAMVEAIATQERRVRVYVLCVGGQHCIYVCTYTYIHAHIYIICIYQYTLRN